MAYTTLINVADLREELDNPDWLVIDTRYKLTDKQAGKKAYQKSHIPGARYLDLDEDLSGPPVTNRGRHPLPTTAAMNALFSRIGITAKTQVVVYDDVSGGFAARLWWMLRHMQHTAVAVLDGGWQAWVDADGPVDTSIKTLPESDFKRQPGKDDVVLIDDVCHHDCIVDSREPGRYLGESEPFGPVAGHIPGAVNRFWKDNLSDSGCYKDKSSLAREFEQLLEGTPATEAVFYCGSGVTACHNLLAAVHAGLPLPKLYAGSWSEWSTTPDKEVATGA